MDSLTHSLNHALPQDIHFDKYAQHILENSRTPNLADTTTIALASSPSITSFDSADPSSTYQQTTSDFLKKLGATFIHSIQLQSLPRAITLDSPHSSFGESTEINDMELEFGPHHLVMDSNNYNNAMDELHKQVDYDKFMNEVWIGIVLALVFISLVFCFCSCFLYHQFRIWKRNYQTTVVQASDIEAFKLKLDAEDPVPEYTLVSGLPSYEAALELLNKSPQSCLLVHPSVFEVFNRNETAANENYLTTEVNSAMTATTEVSMPLLNDATNKTNLQASNETSSNHTANNSILPNNHSLASLLSLATQITTQCKPKSSISTATSASEAEKQFKA